MRRCQLPNIVKVQECQRLNPVVGGLKPVMGYNHWGEVNQADLENGYLCACVVLCFVLEG